jgi:hypothetical protein
MGSTVYGLEDQAWVSWHCYLIGSLAWSENEQLVIGYEMKDSLISNQASSIWYCPLFGHYAKCISCPSKEFAWVQPIEYNWWNHCGGCAI